MPATKNRAVQMRENTEHIRQAKKKASFAGKTVKRVETYPIHLFYTSDGRKNK